MTAANSIVASDYPDNIQTMNGRIEGAVGIGIIIGPLIGMILQLGGLIYTITAFGIFAMLMIPLILKLLGKFKAYEIRNTNFKYTNFIFKPVFFI